MIVYSVVDDALSPDFPLGVELEVCVRREDAERLIEEVRGDDPDVAAKLRVEEWELERPADLNLGCAAECAVLSWRGGVSTVIKLDLCWQRSRRERRRVRRATNRRDADKPLAPTSMIW